MRYDHAARRLELAEPPVSGARWMLVQPAEPRGVPVDRVHEFVAMAEPDLDGTAVCYRTAQGMTSDGVSLREIIEARTYPVNR